MNDNTLTDSSDFLDINKTNKKYFITGKIDLNNSINSADGTKELSNRIGSQEDTQKAVTESQNMIDESNSAINTENSIIYSWEDIKNTDGYATEASINYLNNLHGALTTLGTNLDTTKESAVDLNNLNINVKELLDEYLKKEEKEKEKAEKEAKLSNTNKTYKVTNPDGTTTDKPNPEYNSLLEQISTLTEEISEIDKVIEELKSTIESKYKSIKTIYGDLINFNNISNISLGDNSDNSELNDFSSDEAIKNYMLENNLEYFVYNNCIYNIPSPYEPYKKTKIEFDEKGKYLIKYDLNKLEDLAEDGNVIAEGAIEFMKEKADGSIDDSVRHYITGTDSGKYSIYSIEKGKYVTFQRNLLDQIVPVMDMVLDDSYEASGCETATDYATTAMTVLASGGIWNGQYGNFGTPMQEGITGIVNNSDCISGVNWAEAQGVIKTTGNTNVQALGFCLENGFRNISDKYDSESVLDVGTVITVATGNSSKYHIAMVIGHTTIDGVQYNVIGHTGNRKYGYNTYIMDGSGSKYDTMISTEKLANEYYLE